MIQTRFGSGMTIIVLGFLLLGTAAAAPSTPSVPSPMASPDAPNLIVNGGMEITSTSPDLIAGWTHVSPRDEISPRFGIETRQTHAGKQALSIHSAGSPGTYGYWTTNVKLGAHAESNSNVPFQTNSVSGDLFLSSLYYRFTGYFKIQGVESPTKNILIKVRWKDPGGGDLFCEYVSQYDLEEGWVKANQILTAPRGARSADIELVLKWTRQGGVIWDDFSLVEIPPPAPRKAKVATVSFEPDRPSTPEKNRRLFAEKVAEAGKAGADIVCLGEGISVVSTDAKYAEVAESVPGPTSQRLSEVAKQYHLYVIAGIYERAGTLIYNTALLIGRNGEIVGKYRKTHLPEGEVIGGITPGDSYPVFSTDIGKIGIEICYDNFFPEVARALAVQGAEMIFLPIWGDLRSDGYAWDIAARSRALDNGVYLVTSIYSTKRSLIIDPNGRIITETGGKSGMVLAELDLNARTFEHWLSVGSFGEWKSLYQPERRRDTYEVLIKE
jgi:predicted amidohydrolase